MVTSSDSAMDESSDLAVSGGAAHALSQVRRDATERPLIAALQAEIVQYQEQLADLANELTAREDLGRRLGETQAMLEEAAHNATTTRTMWQQRLQAAEADQERLVEEATAALRLQVQQLESHIAASHVRHTESANQLQEIFKVLTTRALDANLAKSRLETESNGQAQQLATQRNEIETLILRLNDATDKITSTNRRAVELQDELLDAQIDANEWKDRYAALERRHLNEEVANDAVSGNGLNARSDDSHSEDEDSSDEQGGRRGVKRPATVVNEATPAHQRPRLHVASPLAPAMADAVPNAPIDSTPPASPATQGVMNEIWRSTVRDEMNARAQLGEDVDLDEVAWHYFAPNYVALLPSQSWPRGAESAFECIMCHDPYVEHDMVLTLPCAHLVHEDCGKEWLHKYNACPFCTTPIVS